MEKTHGLTPNQEKLLSILEYKGYKIKIVDNSKETATDLITRSYVCTMVAFNPDSTDVGSLTSPYEEKQFFLNVVS